MPLMAKAGLLAQFIFSHRVSTFRGEKWACNIWIKEYLIRMIVRLLPEHQHERHFVIGHHIWDWLASRLLCKDAAILHVMLHGNSLRLIAAARRMGMVIVGEPVNTHPENYFRVIRDESVLCGARHDLEPGPILSRLAEEAKICDYLVCPSEHVRASFIERGAHPERTLVVPFGAELSLYSAPVDWSHRVAAKMSVVCVAQVAPRKGIRTLLHAWDLTRFPESSAELSIIGRLSTEMASVVSRAGPGVKFTGALGRSEVVLNLQRASVFILPTLEEGFAVAILEAMACGCVPITSPASGAESIVLHGVNGFIHDPHDAEGMAESLRLLHRDPGLRERMGRAAAESVKNGFTWDHYVNHYRSIYTKAVRDRGVRSSAGPQREKIV